MKLDLVRIGLGLFVCLGMAGCAAPRPMTVSIPPIPPVQLEAFDRGMKAYEERNYGDALRQFQVVIARFPGSPLLEEAQWMIGKSYESANEFDRALKEYQSFNVNFPKSAHRYEAALRIDFLENVLERQRGRRSFQRYVGVVLSDDPQKAVGRLENAFKDIPIEGPRVVVIQGYGSDGVYFRTQLASVVRESLAGAVKAAHQRGYKVWVRIPIRHLPWFKVSGEERDLRYDPVRKRLGPTDALDCFNPSTLDRLEQFELDLAATGMDGFVIDEDPLIGPWEGFSATAQAAFLMDFGEHLQPDRLIQVPRSAGRVTPAPESSGTPLFWKWTGWKNRLVLGHMAEVMKAVRNRYPSVDWIRVVPISAVTQPQVALARSGIDLLEEKMHGFDYFAIAPSVNAGPDNPFVVLDRMKNLIGDPNRAIVLIPRTRTQWAVSHLNDFQGSGFLFSDDGEERKTP